MQSKGSHTTIEMGNHQLDFGLTNFISFGIGLEIEAFLTHASASRMPRILIRFLERKHQTTIGPTDIKTPKTPLKILKIDTHNLCLAQSCMSALICGQNSKTP
eukprot:gene16489-biopygen4644